jgi:carboxyl-terminal processing protease
LKAATGHFATTCRGQENRKRRSIRFLALCFSLTLANCGIAFAEPSAQDPVYRAVAEAIEQVKAKYVGAIDDQKLIANAIRGIVQGLDPYSDYLEPEAYRELRQENSGKFGGLGLEVGMEAGVVRVVSTFEDSPASRAGLQPGDLITRLNDTSVEGLTLDQTIQRARGEPDTTVALTVLRKGEAQPLVFTLKRAIIQSRTVKSALLGSGYGYVRISNFNQRTADLTLSALTDLYRQNGGSLNGLLIDLRDNPGGLLKSAVAVSSLFLQDDSLVVYTEAATAESRMRLHTNEEQYLHKDGAEKLKQFPDLKNLPLVLLVNSGSASAAEILAGALQDQHRATVAGTQTFGKGSVQVLVPLADGAALKLTTAYYFTPNGRRIQGKGVTPDAVIDALAIDATGAIKPASHATASPVQTACGNSTTANTSVVPDAKNPAIADDCQLQRAVELLRHLPILARS